MEQLAVKTTAPRHRPDQAFIGEHWLTEQLRSFVLAVAPTDVPVMIVGETGTGRELVARWIHANSKRSNDPFVSVDAAELMNAAISEQYRERFAGVLARIFERADRVTIFLEEVGDTPLPFHSELLAAMQTRAAPLFGSSSGPVDV